MDTGVTLGAGKSDGSEPRRPYVAPTIACIGLVTDLTFGGSSAISSDSGQNMMMLGILP